MAEPVTVRLLLVEDDLEDVETIRRFLEKPGGRSDYRLTTANRLQDGLKILKQEPFDLILLDLMLPDSDGFDTLTQFLEKAPKTPIIVITGHQDLAEQAKAFGAVDCLFKGVYSADSLKRVIGYALLARE